MMTDAVDPEVVENVRAKLRLRLPGLKESIGAGDVVRNVTKAMGIKHCSKCDKRRERLNRLLQFAGISKDASNE
jgi:hypothetical protein